MRAKADTNDRFTLTDETAKIWFGRDMWTVQQSWAVLGRGRSPSCPTLRLQWSVDTHREFMQDLRVSLPRQPGESIFNEGYVLSPLEWVQTWCVHGRDLPAPMQAILETIL